MVRLVEVNEENWMDVARLSVREDQRRFLDHPLGIIARGYVYRHCHARVLGILADEQMVGVALVRDFTDEPLGYDLQQFMIDARFQGRGYGKEALGQILSRLREEGRFRRVEVCVHREDVSALRLYERAGFLDEGYVNDALPHCVNLVYRF